MDYPKDFTIKAGVKDIKVKEGTKNSNDSMVVELKMKYEEYIDVSKNDEMSLPGYLGHIWRQAVKVVFTRATPKDGSFNQEVEFVGKIGGIGFKPLKDGPAALITVVGDFKQEVYDNVGRYILKDVFSQILIINPDMVKGKTVETDPEDG